MVKHNQRANGPEPESFPGQKSDASSSSAARVAVKKLLSRYVKAAFKDRTRAAEHLRAVIGGNVTRPKLDDLIAETKLRKNMPAFWIPLLYTAAEQSPEAQHALDELLLCLFPARLHTGALAAKRGAEMVGRAEALKRACRNLMDGLECLSPEGVNAKRANSSVAAQRKAKRQAKNSRKAERITR